jgi:hypothetical protein
MDRDEQRAMKVVWCNPAPPVRVGRRIQLVGLEPGTSTYIVSEDGDETVFELIAGRAVDLLQEAGNERLVQYKGPLEMTT